MSDREFLLVWALERLPDSPAERRRLLKGIIACGNGSNLIAAKAVELLGLHDEFEAAQRELPFSTRPGHDGDGNGDGDGQPHKGGK